MSSNRGGVSDALVLIPECADAHKHAVQLHIAETTLVPELLSVFPMEANVRLRLDDGSVTPWVRTAVQAPGEKRLFNFDVVKECKVVGYDYQPIFTKSTTLSSSRKLLPGDVYNLTWSFNLDI